MLLRRTDPEPGHLNQHLFAVFRTQSAVDPFLRFLNDVLFCLSFCPKYTASSYYDIMELQFLCVLDVGTAEPSARSFILIDCGQDQVLVITKRHSVSPREMQ
jgi:hypothetical protein